MVESSASIDLRRALTSSFSLSSRASFSFFSRSLISLSLTTHAAAPSAAASGCDLFLSRSTSSRKEKRHVSKISLPPTHQCSSSKIVKQDHPQN